MPNDRAPLEVGHPWFAAWARFVIRYRWALLALTLIATVAMGAVVHRDLRVDNSIEAFADNDSPAQRILEEFRDDFGRDDVYLVMIEGDVFSMPYLEGLRTLHEALEGLDLELPSLGERKRDRDVRMGREAAKVTAKPEGLEVVDDGFGDFADSGDEAWGEEEGGSVVERIVSLVNARQVRARADGIEVGELLDPWPTEAELPALRARVLANRTFVGQLVGRDGSHSVIVLRTAFMDETDSERVFREVRKVAKPFDAPGFHVSYAGAPALTHALNDRMMADIRTLMAFSVIGMVILLSLIFRHPIGVVAPLGVVAIAGVWTFGFMALVGMPMTMLSNILPSFLVCVGLGDSIHIVSVYRQRRRGGVENRDAIVQAVGVTGVPVLFTSLTTMVGLSSFRFASMNAIGDMGLAGAFGVSMALAFSFVLLPIALTFNHTSFLGAQAPGDRDLIDRFLGLCMRLSGGRERRKYVRTLLVAVALTAIAGLGISTLRVWHNPMSWLPPDDETRQAFETLDANVGGTADVHLLVETESERGIKDLELLRGLEALEAHIRGYVAADGTRLVGNSWGVLDIVKETHRALHGGGDEAYRLPDTERGAADMLFMFENTGPDEMRQLVTNDLSQARMSFRIKWLDATAYQPLAAHIDAGIQREIGDRASIKTTGAVFSLLTIVGNLVMDLMRSFGVAAVIIMGMMMVLLKDPKLGVIAMAPNLLPIAFILGFMGFADIPIDMSNLIVASIAIGLAVDDTVHFLHHYKMAYRSGATVDEAIQHSMTHSGRAMATTSAILTVGFSVYMASSMVNLQRFGVLVAMTIVFALLVDLIVGPALLRLLYGGDAREAPATHGSKS